MRLCGWPGLSLLFPCFADKILLLSDIIPLLGRVGNFCETGRKIKDLVGRTPGSEGSFFEISLLFPVEQRNQQAAPM